MPKKKNKTQRSNSNSGLFAFLRKPAAQIGILVLVALVVYLLAMSGSGGSATATLPPEVNVDQAYEMYQQEDVFVLDVREPFEWDEYHAPDTTLIPLGELQSRVNELPKDKKIVVICRSGNRSQEGRDILLNAGFDATSVAGGINTWRDKGYPIE